MNRYIPGRPMEILLVEDSLTSARVTMGVLKKGHVQHRLTWIMDGLEAMEFLFNQGKFVHAPRPDLILLDLGLPGKDGREVLAEIKADYELKHIPIVVVTASTDESDRVRSELLHVDGYIVKPIDLHRFLRLVKQLNQFWLDDVILPAVD